MTSEYVRFSDSTNEELERRRRERVEKLEATLKRVREHVIKPFNEEDVVSFPIQWESYDQDGIWPPEQLDQPLEGQDMIQGTDEELAQ